MAYIPDNSFTFSGDYYTPSNSFTFDSEVQLDPVAYSGENADLLNFESYIQFNPIADSGELLSVNLTYDRSYEYNLALCDKELNWEYDNACDIYIQSGETCEFDIEIVKNYEYNFDICGDGNINVDNNDLHNVELEYQEPCDITYRMNSGYTGESSSIALDFESIFIQVPGKSTDNTLKLLTCTADSDIEIEACQQALEVSGKNHQFDFDLCGGERNPQPIDIDPHTFSFNRPWNYICSSISINFYSGESADASIQGGLKFPMDSMYGGESADLTNLGLDISFTNMKGYAGEEADLIDFFTRPFATFDIPNLSGESADADLQPEKVFNPEIAYTGEDADSDMDTTGPIELDPYSDNNGEAGDASFAITSILIPLMYGDESADADLKDDPLILLENPTTLTGEEGDSDLEVYQSQSMEFDSMFAGENGISYLNVTYALSANVYPGENGILNTLNIETTLEVVFDSGSEFDADLEQNLPDYMQPNVDRCGESGDTDLAIELILFPRSYTSEYSDADFTTKPAIYFSPYVDGGERIEIDELFEQTEYYISIGGEYSDAGLSREISFTFDSMYSGEEVKTEALNIDFVILKADSLNNGQYSFAIIETIAGAELDLESMYSGEYAESDTGILYYPIFILDTILSSQVMYDGLGGAGGLNFCHDCCPIPNYYPNNASLTFDVRPQDREPWGRCGPNEDTQFYTDLSGAVRFEAYAHSGEYIKSYIDREYMAFGDMTGSCENVLEFCEPLVCIDGKDKDGNDCVYDDLYWLYNRTPIPHKLPKEHNLEPIITTGERSILYWEYKDDFISLMEQRFSVDLIIAPLVDTMYTGEDFTISLSYDEADWKYPFKRNRGGQVTTFNFEANEYMRFCPGYLIPRGDNVIFDFASPIFTECFGYFTKTGESLGHFILLTESGMSPRMRTGEEMVPSLTTFGPWLLRGYSGERVYCDLSTTVLIYPRVRTGESITNHLYKPPTYWSMDSGESARLAQLNVSLPGIRWITPDGCIKNMFNPLTEDGDIDLEYENYDRCVEFLPYMSKVEAVCDDSVYIYHIIIRPEMMGNNFVVDKISFSTEKFFELEVESGEYAYIQEYVASTGSEIVADLEIFPIIELDDFKLIGGDQTSFATLNTTNTFEFDMYNDEEIILEFN